MDEFEEQIGRELTPDMVSGFFLAMAFSGKSWGALAPHEPLAVEPDEPVISLAQKKSG